MKQNLYVIYDKVAEEAGPVFAAKNDGLAWRMVLGANLPIPPAEYSLFKVGVFNNSPVEIVGINPPEEVRSIVLYVEEVQA